LYADASHDVVAFVLFATGLNRNRSSALWPLPPAAAYRSGRGCPAVRRGASCAQTDP